MRKLTRDDVKVTITAEQDDMPVRGNASAWDDDTDKRVEDRILKRLEEGDVWAWASVRVGVEWEGVEEEEWLGGCCYADEEDFRKPGGYFDDMVGECLERLNERLAGIMAKLG